MSSQEENVALARAGLEAWSRGGVDEVMEFLDPEIEVHTPTELLNAGTFHGHKGYRAWLGEWMDAWDEFELKVLSAEPVGERHVLVEVYQRATGAGSGVEVEMQVTQMYEVRDGKAIRFHIYPERDRALAAVRESEPEAAT
jgi:ketosteroid isomerase-like protein